MLSRRYTILLADRSTGAIRRLTFGLKPTLWSASALLTVALLSALAVRHGILTEIGQLRATNAALHLENVAYRTATGELATRITSLQASMADLSERAELAPDSERAINQLPTAVRARAMGGAEGASDEAWSPMPESAEDTFDVLRDLLHTLQTRLHYVRTDVERREALAEATPSIWPARGWLSASYGTRTDPFTGRPSFHPALDVSADAGSPIYSTASGTIRAAGWSGAYGNLVTVDHDFGIRTRYGHMSRIAVEPKQTVKRGDVIGYVGSTGRTTGAHVHYEVWVNNRPMNPRLLLPRRVLVGHMAD